MFDGGGFSPHCITSRSVQGGIIRASIIYFISIKEHVSIGPAAVVVSYPGGPTIFECTSLSITAIGIDFIVNGSLLDSLALKNIRLEILRNSMGVTRAAILRFEDLPIEYNNTNIQCRANFSMGSPATSTVAVLLLQG